VLGQEAFLQIKLRNIFINRKTAVVRPPLVPVLHPSQTICDCKWMSVPFSSDFPRIHQGRTPNKCGRCAALDQASDHACYPLADFPESVLDLGKNAPAIDGIGSDIGEARFGVGYQTNSSANSRNELGGFGYSA